MFAVCISICICICMYINICINSTYYLYVKRSMFVFMRRIAGWIGTSMVAMKFEMKRVKKRGKGIPRTDDVHVRLGTYGRQTDASVFPPIFEFRDFSIPSFSICSTHVLKPVLFFNVMCLRFCVKRAELKAVRSGLQQLISTACEHA